jgi:hypothetical protein
MHVFTNPYSNAVVEKFGMPIKCNAAAGAKKIGKILWYL